MLYQHPIKIVASYLVDTADSKCSEREESIFYPCIIIPMNFAVIKAQEVNKLQRTVSRLCVQCFYLIILITPDKNLISFN